MVDRCPIGKDRGLPWQEPTQVVSDSLREVAMKRGPKKKVERALRKFSVIGGARGCPDCSAEGAQYVLCACKLSAVHEFILIDLRVTARVVTWVVHGRYA